MMTAVTISVHVKCNAKVAYAFIHKVTNLPRWAGSFIKSVRRAGGSWTIETPHGPMAFRFVPKNSLGVLDHYVSPTSGEEFYTPMRVLSAPDGAEILLTLFRQPGMSAKQFQADQAMVRRDLASLKRVLER